ncbi:MAG: exopolyphosphatase [Bacteroidota bacterium]|nr:MAG: exopolyphosphatase [Bacteroidota bacterium]
MKRIAVLDLGTNTFNILIAEADEKDYTILHSGKRPVKLGEGGINRGEIIPTAIARGLKAIEEYAQIIRQYKVTELKAFGTSALRSASNGYLLTDAIRESTGIEVEIVSGDREAELIYLGVRQTLLLNNKKFLILDIGGGSNEFIVADTHRIYWKKSYNLGIARLLERFKPSDPIAIEEENEIRNYVQYELRDLLEVLQHNSIDTLVGASGSFETFAHLISNTEAIETQGETEAISKEIPLSQFYKLHAMLSASTKQERGLMKGMEPMRIEMIVLASLFVKILFENHTFTTLYQSNFSLKEGAAYEMVN